MAHRVPGWLRQPRAFPVLEPARNPRLALARRAGPEWARLGSVLTFAGAFSLVYLAWGTNDSMALCFFLGALLLAEDHPGWAGAALAVAISYKFLFLVAVPPLTVVLVARGGWAGLRRWWTAPAVLVASSIGFLVAAPRAFVEDVLWFNLGRTKPLMPTSGMGLPATHPDLFHGPVLALATLAGLAVAVGLVPWLAHRYGSIALVGPLTSLALLGILVPARTFQGNYLVLVVGSLATGWWLAPAAPGAGDDGSAGIDAAKRGSVPESGNLETWSNVPPPAPSPMLPAPTSSRTSTAG